MLCGMHAAHNGFSEQAVSQPTVFYWWGCMLVTTVPSCNLMIFDALACWRVRSTIPCTISTSTI